MKRYKIYFFKQDETAEHKLIQANINKARERVKDHDFYEEDFSRKREKFHQ